MKKHHLLLAYIFLATFSFASHAMEGETVVEPHKGFGARVKGLFHRLHQESSPPFKPEKVVQRAAVVEQVKQENLVFSEVFPGAEKLAAIEVEKRGPMGVPHATTNHAVSVCTIKDQAFLAYIDLHGHVNVVQSKDLIHWTKPVDLFGDGLHGVTYVNCFTFQDKPFVTCGGKMTFLKDGKTWEEPYALEHAENSLFVTMLAQNDTVYAAHTGKDQNVYFTSSKDAVHWDKPIRVSNWTTQFPVGLVYESALQSACLTNQGSLFLASHSYGWVNYIPKSKDSSWKTNYPISLCASGNNVYVAHLGENNIVNISATSNAFNEEKDWSEAKSLEQIKTDRPICLFVHLFYKPRCDDKLLIAYKGLDSKIYIVSRFSY